MDAITATKYAEVKRLEIEPKIQIVIINLACFACFCWPTTR